VLDFSSDSYALGSGAAQRGNYREGSPTFPVRMDGTVVGTFTRLGTAGAVYGTHGFNVRTGTHPVTVVGLNPDEGGDTAVIDRVFLELA
jgi:hypothetical protein